MLLTIFACYRSGTTGGEVEVAGSQTELRGKLVIAGSEPATSVQLVGSKGNVELVGALEQELRRLAGASVTVRGSLQGKQPVQKLEVQSYEIMDIDGEIPSTGVLHYRNGQLWLAGKDTLKLVGAPETLKTKDGAKVWIVGPRSADKLQVQSYGVIRE